MTGLLVRRAALAAPRIPRLRPSKRLDRQRRLLSLSANFNADPLLVDDRMAPTSWTKTAAVVYRDVITEEQASLISNEILGHRMRRKRYEKGHWDSVITDYKEMELYDIHQIVENMENENDTFNALENAQATMASMVWKIRNLLQQNHAIAPVTKWLPCHAIDLKKEGQLSAHVDSVRFSGHMVAGLSLLSPAIMRLKEEEEEKSETFVDLYLPPNSLYVLTGVGRYDYSHELLPDGSVFGDQQENPIVVPREQRLSIIFRDAKEEDE